MEIEELCSAPGTGKLLNWTAPPAWSRYTQSLKSLRETPKHENAPSPQLPSPSSLSPGEREEREG